MVFLCPRVVRDSEPGEKRVVLGGGLGEGWSRRRWGGVVFSTRALYSFVQRVFRVSLSHDHARAGRKGGGDCVGGGEATDGEERRREGGGGEEHRCLSAHLRGEGGEKSPD